MSFRLIEAERAQHPVSLLRAVLGVTGTSAGPSGTESATSGRVPVPVEVGDFYGMAAN
jgi:hypothetical protein